MQPRRIPMASFDAISDAAAESEDIAASNPRLARRTSLSGSVSNKSRASLMIPLDTIFG